MPHPPRTIRRLFVASLLALAPCLLDACTSATSHSTDGGGQGGAGGTGQAGTGGAAQPAGGSPGSGGHASGGATGNPNGGASGGGGNSGVGGRPAGATGGSTGGCASLPLCDTFETTTAGAAPNPGLWTLIPSPPSGTATIDTVGAHGSSQSLKVSSTGRLYLRNSSVIGTLGPVVHVRFYARFATALAAGHGAMIVTHPVPVDQYVQQPELRFGSQDSVFHWNTDTDQANIPDVSPNGDMTSFKPVALTWYCIELTINANGHLNVSVDGSDIAGLTEDEVATPNIDQAWVASTQSKSRYTAFADFNVGWQSYGSGDMTVWFDDVALSGAPIGCTN